LAAPTGQRATAAAGEWRARLALLAVSLLVGLFILEIGCRLYRGQSLLHWPNMVAAQFRALAQSTPQLFAPDPLLGVVPKPGLALPTVHVGADGTRAMPPLPADASPGPPVLATGDSFAFGADVGDDDAWPAILQGLIKRPTINAGGPGYGFDQTVLYTQRMAEQRRPGVIVVSLIADDIWRMEMKRIWARNKPYFTLATNGALDLHIVPGPLSGDTTAGQMSIWQALFGWSSLVQTVLQKLSWHDIWTSDDTRALPAGAGERLVCPLMGELARIGIPTLLVMQYEPLVFEPGHALYTANQRRLAALALDCAKQAKLATLDTYDVVAKGVVEHGYSAIYFGEHHTGLGNRLIAEAIAADLRQRGW
jgi:hypothetical protein